MQASLNPLSVRDTLIRLWANVLSCAEARKTSRMEYTLLCWGGRGTTPRASTERYWVVEEIGPAARLVVLRPESRPTPSMTFRLFGAMAARRLSPI